MKHVSKTNSSHAEVLIVGGGISGMMLGWHFYRRGIPFHILDQGYRQASSYRAAGLINPVTGRRFVKSWMYDRLEAYLIRSYTEISEYLGIEVLNRVAFLRDFSSPLEENIWLGKCGQPEYAPYISYRRNIEVPHSVFRRGKLVGITRGWRVNSPVLLDGLHERWRSEGMVFSGRWEQEIWGDIPIELEGRTYDTLIFATGAAFPLVEEWKQLPLIPNGGEYFILRIEALDTGYLLKRKEVLVPLGNHRYWFGATYDWEGKIRKPSVQGGKYLREALEALIDCRYEMVTHEVGIRPTVKNRRPLIGSSSRHPSVHLFTGFGTKGFSLTPYWANEFVEHLYGGKPLDASVDLRRCL